MTTLHEYVSDSYQRRVADWFNITLDELMGPSRYRTTVQARHVGMYLARKSGLALRAVAQMFGRTDHATVIHACRSVERQLPENEILRLAVRELGNP